MIRTASPYQAPGPSAADAPSSRNASRTSASGGTCGVVIGTRLWDADSTRASNRAAARSERGADAGADRARRDHAGEIAGQRRAGAAGGREVGAGRSVALLVAD